MSRRRCVFEGVVTPVQSEEEDFLYIHKILYIEGVENTNITHRCLGITDFFSRTEVVYRTPCVPSEKGDLECDIKDCPFFRDGKCKPPKFRVKLVLEIEEVGGDEY